MLVPISIGVYKIQGKFVPDLMTFLHLHFFFVWFYVSREKIGLAFGVLALVLIFLLLFLHPSSLLELAPLTLVLTFDSSVTTLSSFLNSNLFLQLYSVEPCSIHLKMLRHLLVSSLQIVLHICNRILESYLEDWLKEVGLPIRKCNTQGISMNDFRLIAQTCCVCKVFKCIINVHLV